MFLDNLFDDGLPITEGVKKTFPRVFYRGTTPGETRRIRTGEPDWDNNLFVSSNRDGASMYGSFITVYEAKPDAKIVYQGTKPFISLAKGLNNPGWNFQSNIEIVRRAKAAGWDAVWFKNQGDIGTVVLNPSAFEKKDENPLEEAELPMDDASRMARAKQLGFTIAAYHGTNMKFDEFEVEKGKPNPLSGHGPHFTDSKKEARGYAGRKKTSSVLEVLLRIKNPFNMSRDKQYSAAEYKKIIGHAPKDTFDAKGSYILSDLRKAIIKKHANLPPTFGGVYNSPEFHKHSAAWEAAWEAFGGNKRVWIEIYKKLQSLGYDALYDPACPADHANGTYQKYVIFDSKNVRSINAAFDPAQSDSRNLMG